VSPLLAAAIVFVVVFVLVGAFGIAVLLIGAAVRKSRGLD
jgi:hypothetical protein